MNTLVRSLSILPIKSVGFAMTSLALSVAMTGVAEATNLRTGFNSNTLARNDDGSTGLVDLGFTANFFGNAATGENVYNQVYVNNNGNVTFRSPLSTFTPFGLTGSTNIPIIAAFFADVDTRGAASSEVTYGRGTVNGRNAFGANYVNVGYYSGKTDKINDFQLVLIDRADTGAGNFDIEFNYNRIQWETGEASGGTGGLGGDSARIGFSNGTGRAGTFFELCGSGIDGAFLDGAAAISCSPQASINASLAQTANALATGSNLSGNLFTPGQTSGFARFSARGGNVGIDPTPSPTSVPEPFTIVGTLIGATAAFKMRKRLKVTNKL